MLRTLSPVTACRILIVEDDCAIGELLTEILTYMGHCVCGTATTEAGAVEAALLHKPDLMIVDAKLAVGSGIDAVATIARTASIPHIFISGDWRPARGQNATVLLKPFTQRDLIRAIDRTMSVRRSAKVV